MLADSIIGLWGEGAAACAMEIEGERGDLKAGPSGPSQISKFRALEIHTPAPSSLPPSCILQWLAFGDAGADILADLLAAWGASSSAGLIVAAHLLPPRKRAQPRIRNA